MSRFFGIVNLVVIIFLAALLTGYMTYRYKESNEIEQLKLSYAIDYATDAGTMAMLDTASLDMDYSKFKYLNMDPNLALDAFLDVFCFNYDLPPTKENKDMMKDYIPVAAVATFDGYYLASHQLVHNNGGDYPETAENDSDWDLVFGMKLPYSYKPDGNSSATYALNMGLEYYYALEGGTLSKQMGLPPDESGTLTPNEARKYINDKIANSMADSIDTFNENNPNWQNSFYIPSSLTTFSGVNPIEGPSFLVLVQGLNLTTARSISGFSVSGSKIDLVRSVVGYTRNGQHYYAFADKVPEGVAVEELFTSLDEAAEDGYSFDPLFMN
ncbi:hypothetical protein [Cohnella fermenti]|uniref:Uncharacterized protein n=1 Tax=Cohnella fermenti TaxID=2565925 RepID=A0A4S4BHE1_9BACL|nr:hypothetical protein [Cohnella fermenti]THF73914.1 hypothetical protein E6C55_26965 [Cohnella fermenti]